MKTAKDKSTLLVYFPGDEGTSLQEVTYMSSTTGSLKGDGADDDDEGSSEGGSAVSNSQKYLLAEFGKKWKNHLFIIFLGLIIFIVFASMMLLHRRHYEEAEVFNLTNATFHHRIDLVHESHHRYEHEHESQPEPAFSIRSSGRHKTAPACVCTVAKMDPRTGTLQRVSLDFSMTHSELHDPVLASLVCQKKCAANRAQMLAQLKARSALAAKRASFSSIRPTEIPEPKSIAIVDRRPVKHRGDTGPGAREEACLAKLFKETPMSKGQPAQCPLKKKSVAASPLAKPSAETWERRLPAMLSRRRGLIDEPSGKPRSILLLPSASASSSMSLPPSTIHDALMVPSTLSAASNEPWTLATPAARTSGTASFGSPAILSGHRGSDFSQHI